MRKTNSLLFFFLVILVILISGCSDPVTENENILIDANEGGQVDNDLNGMSRRGDDLSIGWRTMSDTSMTPHYRAIDIDVTQTGVVCRIWEELQPRRHKESDLYIQENTGWGCNDWVLSNGDTINQMYWETGGINLTRLAVMEGDPIHRNFETLVSDYGYLCRKRVRFTGPWWEFLPIKARDVSIDHMGETWIISYDGTKIYKTNRFNQFVFFASLPAGTKGMAIDAGGYHPGAKSTYPWIVTTNNKVYQLNPTFPIMKLSSFLV